jgi:hypothetical protein
MPRDGVELHPSEEIGAIGANEDEREVLEASLGPYFLYSGVYSVVEKNAADPRG